MQQGDIRKRIWELFSPIAVKIAVGLMVEVAVIAVFYLKYMPDLSAAASAEQSMEIYLKVTDEVYKYIVEITAVSALATMPFLILMRQSDKRKETVMGLVPNNKAPFSKYVYVVGISIAFAVALNNILLLSDLASYSIAYQEASEALYTPSLAVQIVCLGIITPIMEEYIFRGLVFKRLRCRYSARRAIVTSALFFGMYHGNLVQTIYGTLSGILLGYLYEKYGSLKAPVLAHMMMNIVACLLTEADVFTWMFSETTRMAIITVGCASIASIMFLYIQKIEEKPQILQGC